MYDNSLFPWKKYVDAKYIPSAPIIKRHVITLPTNYRSYDGVLIIYIKSGNGHILINGDKYPISSGNSFILHSFMFFKLCAGDGAVLDYYEIELTAVSYHFMISIPGADFSRLEHQSDVCTIYVPEDSRPDVEKLIEDIQTLDYPELRCICLYELTGRLMKY